jgi:hypothetical protein
MRLIHVSVFKPANELDGPYQEAAVALRFPYDARLVATLKTILYRFRQHPPVGGWSRWKRCWYVRAGWWDTVRERLLEEGVRLHGPLAHPRRQRPFGFFAEGEVQLWSRKECAWVWPPLPRPGRRRRKG